MQPRAYVYTRMSSLEQLKGDSKRRQRQKGFEYARGLGLEVVALEDFGVSAFRGNNAMFGELANFLADLRLGSVVPGSYLIVESLDRLSRDEVHNAFELLLSIVNAGVTLVTLFDGHTYSKQSVQASILPLMIALTSFSTASEESKKKSIRLGEAWSQKKELGRASGKPLTAITPAWLRLDRKRNEIVPIPERVAIVEEIFNLYSNGWGANSITRKLNDRAEPTWSPRKEGRAFWQESYVKKILCNRAVLGEYLPHKNVYVEGKKVARVPDGEPIVGYFPVVIDELTFELAAEAGRSRRVSGAGRKGEGYSNLFTGLLVCRCGAGIRYVNKGQLPKGGQYLICSAKEATKLCSVPHMKYQVFEDAMLRHLEGINLAKALGTDASQNRLNELGRDKATTEIELRKVKLQQQRLVEVLMSGEGGSPSFLSTQASKLQDEQTSLERKLETLDQELKRININDPEAYKAMLDQLVDQLRSADGSDLELLRRSLAAEIKKIVSRIRISYEPLVEYDEEGVEVLPSDLGHIANIDYHSSMSQLLEIKTGKNLKLRWSRSHVLMKKLNR